MQFKGIAQMLDERDIKDSLVIPKKITIADAG
jgi:hypothetical protein